MCTRICSIAQGQIQAEEPVKRTPFWGWFTKRFFRAWQVQLGNRPCSVFDGMALLKSCCTWSRLGVTSSCYVSFPMCVWISTCLGSLLRVLLSTLEDKAPPVQSEAEETHEALDGSWNLQVFSKLCHSKIREHHRICNSSWPVACCKWQVAVKGHSANAEALLDLIQNLWIAYDRITKHNWRENPEDLNLQWWVSYFVKVVY